jgi:DNA-3-methyladenine glycosylase
MPFKLKRVYEPASPDDGYRILIDRLWPRGVSRDAADVDLWLRRIAPSDELREWYGHELERWPEFRERYRDELASHGDLVGLLHDIEHHRGVVTLLFGAKDEEHNEANVLLEVLKSATS